MIQNKNVEIDPVKYVEETVKTTHDIFEKKSKPVFKRYPFIFGTLVTFGALFVMYGFERFADRVPLFYENPGWVFIFGVTILLLTGTLYKKIKH